MLSHSGKKEVFSKYIPILLTLVWGIIIVVIYLITATVPGESNTENVINIIY